jgi:putative endonuclease
MDYWVYIAGSRSGTLYVGVTREPRKRMWEHREGVFPGFTSRYRVHRLLYFERTDDVWVAITREKQIKGWRRSKKDDLIRSQNPGWRDLSKDLFDD